jgi:hypothetical protein
MTEVATTEPAARYRSPVDPALDQVDGDLSAAEAGPIQKRPHAEKGGDESGSPSGQNTPDWQKTATDAAVGVAARIASGPHGHGSDHDGDPDDRATKPF